MARKVTRYTVEYKQEAVNLALKSPNIEATAKELGIPSSTLRVWINAIKNKVSSANLSKDGAKDMATLIEENSRLHKELAIAKEEKEILKKAAAYFAQHQK